MVSYMRNTLSFAFVMWLLNVAAYNLYVARNYFCAFPYPIDGNLKDSNGPVVPTK